MTHFAYNNPSLEHSVNNWGNIFNLDFAFFTASIISVAQNTGQFFVQIVCYVVTSVISLSPIVLGLHPSRLALSRTFLYKTESSLVVLCIDQLFSCPLQFHLATNLPGKGCLLV